MPEAAKSSSYSFQHPQSRTVKKKETESPVIRTIGSSFLPKKQEEQQNPETVKSPEIDYSKFIEEGIYRYKPLKNSSTLGIEYLSDYSTSSRALQLQSTARITATIGSIGLSAMAILGLVSSGIKLILSTLFGIGNEEEAFENLGSAYKKSSVAGILTGLAHENPLWAVGNGLMGLAGKLDNVFKLAFFTIGDGLSSIGMGQVRFKEKGNAFAIKKSIFDNKNLSYLSFLKPIEHSIYSFAKRFSTANGWKLFQQAEPYALYNDAGGGLVTGGGGALVIAGGALAAAKMFGNTLSEGFQSFSYLPASIFSLVNLMAFYRDGAVQVDRSHYIGGGKKKSEKITQRIEGYLKQAATPFLGFRNLSFAAKGIGLDTGGIFHCIFREISTTRSGR